MNRPVDVDDLAQCVKIHDGRVYIFCVECDDWKQVGIQTEDTYLTTQAGVKRLVASYGKKYVCAACYADVGYLLPGNWRQAVGNRITA